MKIDFPRPGWLFRHIMKNTQLGKALDDRPGVRLLILVADLAMWLSMWFGGFALGWFLGGIL